MNVCTEMLSPTEVDVALESVTARVLADRDGVSFDRRYMAAVDVIHTSVPVPWRAWRTFSPHAASDSGCWSRGLAWHIAGSLEAYKATGDQRYRDSVGRNLQFYERHADLVPRCDCGAGNGPLDTSAAAITEPVGRLHCGSVASRPRRPQRRLLHGCYSMSSRVAIDAELIWGEYYLASALALLAARPDVYGCDD